MGNLSLGYELDSMSNIGASIGLTSFAMKNDGHPMTTFSGGPYGTGFSYGNEMTMKNKNTSFNGSIDYQRFFNKARTSSLTLSYLFSTTPAENTNLRVYDPLPAGVTIPLRIFIQRRRCVERSIQCKSTIPHR